MLSPKKELEEHYASQENKATIAFLIPHWKVKILYFEQFFFRFIALNYVLGAYERWYTDFSKLIRVANRLFGGYTVTARKSKYS